MKSYFLLKSDSILFSLSTSSMFEIWLSSKIYFIVSSRISALHLKKNLRSSIDIFIASLSIFHLLRWGWQWKTKQFLFRPDGWTYPARYFSVSYLGSRWPLWSEWVWVLQTKDWSSFCWVLMRWSFWFGAKLDYRWVPRF